MRVELGTLRQFIALRPMVVAFISDARAQHVFSTRICHPAMSTQRLENIHRSNKVSISRRFSFFNNIQLSSYRFAVGFYFWFSQIPTSLCIKVASYVFTVSKQINSLHLKSCSKVFLQCVFPFVWSDVWSVEITYEFTRKVQESASTIALIVWTSQILASQQCLHWLEGLAVGSRLLLNSQSGCKNYRKLYAIVLKSTNNRKHRRLSSK